MAITAAQRILALQAITQTALYGSPFPVPNGVSLATLLPGVTADEVWSAIATALGTTVDTSLTTALNNVATLLNNQLTNVEANVTALQAQITAVTVA